MEEFQDNQKNGQESGGFQPAPQIIGSQEHVPDYPPIVPAPVAPEQRDTGFGTAAPIPEPGIAGYGTAVPNAEPKKKKSGLGGMIAVALCCSLLGGVVGAGGMALLQQLREPDPEEETILEQTEPTPGAGNKVDILEGVRQEHEIEIVPIPTEQELTAAQVYAANVNSTVGITTSYTTTNFWGYQSTSAAAGSGFIVSEDGYIVTNYHVVEQSDTITVACYDGTEYAALLVGYDESNDIAVLKVEATGLSPVILGDSDDLNVGDDVLAIGNPLGELTFTLTAGKISAKDREVTFSNNVTMDLLQTDCAINSGNSGGALFNMYGEVVGVTNAKYSGNSGSGASIDNIAFAIPINTARPIVESIIEEGYVTKPFVGVTVSDVGQEYQDYGIPQGAAIQSVVQDSPAQKAGLKKGDIVTAVDGKALTSAKALVDDIGTRKAGDQMALTVYRRGQTVEITVTVEERIVSGNLDE